VDAALPGGECLHVAIPDATRADWAINIRKYVVRAGHLDDLVALGSLTPVAARFLAASVTAGLNVLVSGPTQAGKTTMLNALAGVVVESNAACWPVPRGRVPGASVGGWDHM